MLEFTIRKYRDQDRSSLFKIGADTAFFGDPVEAYLDDRLLFLDAFYAFCTDIEPNYCWVASCDDQVIGFLTGCINTRKPLCDRKRIIFLRGIKGILLGK